MQKASKISLQARVATIKHVQDVKSFGQLRAYQLERWVVLADKPKRRRGRKVRQAFEEEVWAKLVICTLKVVDGVPVATVIHNVVYNFSIVKLAAKEIQKTPEQGYALGLLHPFLLSYLLTIYAAICETFLFILTP